MADVPVLKRSARWRFRLAETFARRRVPTGFVLGAAAVWLARPTPRSLQIGALLALAGEAVRIWAAGHVEKGREVTTSGPYRFTRHPLYLGSTIMGVGLSVAAASVVVAALVLGYLAITLTAAMRTEESHLTEKFGGAYPAYREGRVEGERRRFSVQRAIRNREYRAVIGVVLVLAVLWWKAWRN
jgi:protein-S-isoprenylcysteine O-methyltransferase Ste14